MQNTVNEKNAVVGIAGIGGLGSHVAVMLARSSIRKLVLADFDCVDESNLKRQSYYYNQIGLKKTDALAGQLKSINPFLEIETHFVKVDEQNAAEIFKECRIVCEAFDKKEEKAMLVNTLLEQLPDTILISGSGMAGIESSNLICTARAFQRLYVCGDGVTEADGQVRLTAARVCICAGHEANMVLRLLNGYKEA